MDDSILTEFIWNNLVYEAEVDWSEYSTQTNLANEKEYKNYA